MSSFGAGQTPGRQQLPSRSPHKRDHLRERIYAEDSAHSDLERRTHAGPAVREKATNIMFITIAAVVICICVAVLPAAAEIRRMTEESDNPTRLLKIPTRRAQVEASKRL
ncbi:hypothetical protein [Enhygromyxa salina]|uniref:Transmembrane protein n=1 Tax=Enhygromyxa salina TaxID=215803 RepID=A0A2S9XLD5_9BACT|nr:hypothetical protein [Enhygromyxa salina]PRP93665.1 hypothetical protein ENSA7_80930 [Enhygromyxa salina]